VSAALIKFDIIPEGGETFRVEALSRDVLVWEKRSRDNSFARLRDNLTMAAQYHLAHIAARRTGQFDGDLSTFEQTCDLMPVPDEESEGELDPTNPGQ
jgi:hypothetical protein